MNKITKLILIAITVALSAYVALYYFGVSPDGGVDSEARIPIIRGWSPSYPPYENHSLESYLGGPQMRWNNFVYRLFTPIHRIDRIIRKDLWLTAEEKREEIRLASQPPTPFSPDMAGVRVLDEPWQDKKYRKANYLELMSFRDGMTYHSFTNCATANWEEGFVEISRIIISKAKSLDLDTVSLQQALDLILKHSEGRIPYLPVSVNQVEFNDRLVWIIRVQWQSNFNHVRYFVFDQETLELVKYQTCMG